MPTQQMILVGGPTRSAPANTVSPAITGSASVGVTLSCSTGSWTQSPSSYSYQWKRGATSVGTNSSTYLLVSGDVGSTMTCEVTATNAAGSTMQVSNATSAVAAAPGQQAYTTAGTYSWTAPAGVTSVSVVVVGSGKSFGGALAYKNNISVVPGNSYSVFLAGAEVAGSLNYFIGTTTVSASQNSKTGDGGGLSGGGSGAGAGGYAGAGGVAGTDGDGTAGAGGGGGGSCRNSTDGTIGAGGGVGILGQGSNGAGTVWTGTYPILPGGAGSGAGAGGNTLFLGVGGAGGTYGGVAGESGTTPYTGASSIGAVRIIWPGTTRQFPSTNTADI